jgi:hypothetical protein
MTSKKDRGARPQLLAQQRAIARGRIPTETFSLAELWDIQQALRSVLDFATADQLSALWQLDSLLNLVLSQRHWTKAEIRKLRHDVALESIDELGWTKGFVAAADRLKDHYAASGKAGTMREAFKAEQRRLPAAQRRPRTWRRRQLG